MIDKKEIKAIVAKYRQPDLKRSIWQMINSFVLYVAAWTVMVYSLSVSVWLTLLLAIPAGGFMVRIFIIFHDCGHGSYFKSTKANNFWGMVTGFFVFTPYYMWRHEHALHHATAGDLDKRGNGDVWTLTVEQYRDASTWTKIQYRVYRNPFILFSIGALINFIFIYRFSTKVAVKKDRIGVYLTNLVVVGMAALLSYLLGWKTFLLIQISILAVAASSGIWLFYFQHQFEGVYWERHEKWDSVKAALLGSSFYKLPKVLQWFSGNIGYHHIHHLSPSIPNYYLEKCHKENDVFQQVKPVTIFASFKSLSLRLYDEASRKLVGYHVARGPS